MAAAPPGSVASVERALRVLDAFGPQDDAVSLADLAARTGLYKSTLLRLASTLQTHGYLIRAASGEFRIGHAPLRLAALYLRSSQPADRIMPFLEQLVRDTGESASFTVRREDAAICIYRVDSPQIVRDHVRPGDAHPLDVGASGKAILAFSRPYRPRFAAIRKEGLAFSSGELTRDFASIAAPVHDAAGVCGSIAVSGPSNRFGGRALSKIRPLLLAAARNVSLGLGADIFAIEADGRGRKRDRKRR
jgi:DNA-binding IclR family transcriptional regulator